MRNPFSSSPLPVIFPTIVEDKFPLTELLPALLDISLTGVVLLSPMYNPRHWGELVDYAIHYANPVAQRVFRLPTGRPLITYLQQFPSSIDEGAFDLLNEVLATGRPGYYESSYVASGRSNCVSVACRRVGAGILLSVANNTVNQSYKGAKNVLRKA